MNNDGPSAMVSSNTNADSKTRNAVVQCSLLKTCFGGVARGLMKKKNRTGKVQTVGSNG